MKELRSRAQLTQERKCCAMGKVPQYNSNMLRILFIVLFCTVASLHSQDGGTFAFWNVENLFDLYDDPVKNDDEFALNGKKNNSVERFQLKLDHMAEVMTELNADVLGLCEVENHYVLDQLNRTFTARNYSIIHVDSPDERGIDVALLYDPDYIQILHEGVIPVPLPNDDKTRDILYVVGRRAGHDIHIFINHWPSKWGGVEATIPLRAAAGKTLRRAVDRILSVDSFADILIMGDLNDEPFEPSITEHLGAPLYRGQDVTEFTLTDLMTTVFDAPDQGTYMFNGKHSVIDHIIVSRGILDSRGWSGSIKDVRVLDKSKYRQQSGKYKDYPFRFWAGNRLLGGYSDHLPVLIRLTVAP